MPFPYRDLRDFLDELSAQGDLVKIEEPIDVGRKTNELAALQSLVDPEQHLELDGLSDSAWRERIGNAVPPEAAKGIASVLGKTLLLAWSGETFMLSAEAIWVQPIAVALSVMPVMP